MRSTAVASALSLPKGGGAIKGIGETFKANLFSGTGAYSIPLALSPGRGGFGPKLSLEYSSGNGNGVFGLGWQLAIPRITRKTEKGLPRYDDQDIFVMSGAEDLVPWLRRVVNSESSKVSWQPEEPILRAPYRVHRYRPRTEGVFARIERWVHDDTGETHWRTISKDNVTSVFGFSSASRLSDPESQHRVYEWLLDETFDAVGNHILYEYVKDDPRLYEAGETGHLPEVFERNRHATQLYIRRLYYGNFPEPSLDVTGKALTYPTGAAVGHLRRGRRYAFEVVFDYGDWDSPTILLHPEPLSTREQEFFGTDTALSTTRRSAPLREDRHSHYRAGFEVRTLRRCERVLMFHHFAELGSPTLVRSTDFTYRVDQDTKISVLMEVTVQGYEKDGSGQYRMVSMPPVSFAYTEFRPHEQHYQSLTAAGDDLPSQDLGEPSMALVDLLGDGLPSMVQSDSSGIRYWRNLGAGRFDRHRTLPQVPAGVLLGEAGVGFGDMDGDGQVDLLVHTESLAGFFETTSDGAWKKFTPYESFPGFDLTGRNMRLLDLTGDGRSDALVTEENQFRWYECLGEKGFAPARTIARFHDLDQFPDVYFDDPSGRVRLADMSGDGLNDMVLVHNGRIDYWPNLGYGRFGRRITMANAPRLDTDFDFRRLFLVDLNGTGCADLVYVDFNRVHFWFNQSGNHWSDAHTIIGTPTVSDADSVQFADVFGTGTATLLWSSRVTTAHGRPYKALDFCGGLKPYILAGMDNNMGATTRVSYAPSTRFCLEDEANGNPWFTKLPFPVQVVDKVEVIDHISRTKLVTRYQYHHGYYDGQEREFRGFGRVDQFDTETFEDFTHTSLHGEATALANGTAAYHVPPVETRSWFHTGIYFEDHHSSGHDYLELTERFRRDFYQADREAGTVDEHQVEIGDAPHEAYRVLRGAVLRTEVYAHDGSAKSPHPYQVTENRYRIIQLQPKDGNHHAVYFSHQLERLTYDYERRPSDPRISHALTLEVDAFGNELRSMAIGYGRRQSEPQLSSVVDQAKQTNILITYTQSRYTNAIDDRLLDPDNYRAPTSCETRSYELTGFRPGNNARRFSWNEWRQNNFERLDGTVEIAYEAPTDEGLPRKRLIEHVRTQYRANDLSGLLPFGVLESLALPGESYRLAFTPGLLTQVYGDRITPPMLAGEGGYVRGEHDGNWWIPSGHIFYSPHVNDASAAELAFARAHFFLPHRSRDPFGNTAFIRYDHYHFLPVHTTDALGNRALAEYDYRLLQPFRLTDANGNRGEVAFDTLGMVAGTAVMGKVTETLGDSLAGFQPNLSEQQKDTFMSDPLASAPLLLGQATTRIVYDLDRYRRVRQPVFAATLTRETHTTDPLPTGGLKVQVGMSYSDGFSREIQQKMQAEPGPLVPGGAEVPRRWVGSGWTFFNNKGKAVKQYEPFFDDTHVFRFDHRVGVSSTLFYDPMERVVGTLHPNHTWEKVRFNPWRQETWDVNDTTLIEDPTTDADVGMFFRRLPVEDYLPTWNTQRRDGGFGPLEQAAAVKTAIHAATPTVSHADALGRGFLTIAHNRSMKDNRPIEEQYVTRTVLDIEGNQREVSDANGRVVMQYDYNLLGNQVRQAGMEVGERRVLADVTGQPLYAWDDRGHRLRATYDALRRPLEAWLQEPDGATRLVGQTLYGETQVQPESRNLRGKIFLHRDQAGVVISETYDFKGNVLTGSRQLAGEYKRVLDWAASPELDGQVFASRTTYDALSRPVSATAPDGSVHRPIYNAATLLERVDVTLRGAPTATSFVSNIDYDAKGQRTLIEYGNGVKTHYVYDPLTFRLIHLQTVREAERVQDLTYVYDPVGNVTHIHDAAQQTVYFRNQVVEPHADYTYDALYRLISAEGREHIGQATRPETSWDDAFRSKLPHPHDGSAMRRYTEQYRYDGVGNILQLNHQATNGNWTRFYTYDEGSLLEPEKKSNRLSVTTVGTGSREIYQHDRHGNMLTMPHLSALDWDFRNQLRHVDLGGGGHAYYVYDASGQRVRKVVERNGGALIEERLYLGDFEIFRRRNASGAVVLERETLHVMDDKRRMAQIETRTKGEEQDVPAQLVRYQFGNHLGSASLELDATGQIITYEEYYPYGSTSYQAGRTVAEVNLKRYRYTGMERDEETGLNYHGARYFAPWLSRWSSADPVGIKGGINLYAYSAGNPIRYSDVTGKNPDESSQPSTSKPGLLTLDYSQVCGGPCLTDDQIYAEYNEWKQRDVAETKQAEDRAIAARKERVETIDRLKQDVANAQRGTRAHRYARERFETYRDTGVDPGIRQNIDGGHSIVNSPKTQAQVGAAVLIPVGFAATFPRIAAVLGAWTTGTATGEAATGRSVGAMNPFNLMSGNTAIGRPLSTPERVLSGVTGVLGVSGIALARPKPGGGGGSGGQGSAFSFATEEAWIYEDRMIRVVNTPTGPRAAYQRLPRHDDLPVGAQPGDWAFFNGFQPALFGAHFVKQPFTTAPYTPLTLYRWGNEEARLASAWLNAQPVPTAVQDVAVDTWGIIQARLQALGVYVEYP